MNRYELNDSVGATLMEEQPVKDRQLDADLDMDVMPYEDFISMVEDEVLSEERDNNTDALYLRDYLKIIKNKKEIFLTKIRDESRRASVEAFFGIEEMVVKNLIEKVEGRSEEFKIEDAKWQQEIIFYINKNKDNSKELKMFWDEYDTLFAYEDDSQSGKKYKAGIMAPLGLQNILQEKYGLEVVYSKPEDDVRCSVDMVAVDRKNKLNFLIQVKTDIKKIEEMIDKILNSKKNNQEKISDTEKEKKLIEIVERTEFGKQNKDMHEDYQKFSNGCSRYIEKYKGFLNDEGYKTTGVYLYVPCVIKGERAIGVDGTPSHELWTVLVGGGLEKKLNLPNIFNYDSVLGDEK